MSDTPIYDATLIALAAHYAREAVREQMARTPRKPRRQSETRLAILHASPLLYAIGANT